MTTLATKSLCIGDYVCLYCDVTEGYVCSWQSSESFSSVYVFTKQSRDNPEHVPNPQILVFQVLLQNRYKLNKKYRKLLEVSKRDSDNAQLRTLVAEAKACAEAETGDNTDEQERMVGKPISYGDIVQLKHSFTGKLIHSSTTQTSSRDKNNLTVFLDHKNGKQAQFRILPRYNVKEERDRVQFQDQIIFESIKSPGQYFHASSPFQIDRKYVGSELNLGVDCTGLTLVNYYRPLHEKDSFIRSGSVIRLFHRVLEAHLVAEGLFDEQLIEAVHLRVRTMDTLRPNSLDPSTSSITYWQVIDESSIIQGDVLRWGQQIRFRHMTTGLYLWINTQSIVGLSSNSQDPLTVFRLHSVTKDESEEAKFESFARIEHVLSGRWLHADSGWYRSQWWV